MSSSQSQVIHDLTNANHILHHHKVVDTYGHISVRNPQNPKTFFLSRNLAPALVSSDDLFEYSIEDASPVNPKSPKSYLERYIHSEILKRFPKINSAVHSHSEAVLAYAISGVPMVASFHMAGFLGTHVPVFDIADHYQRSDSRDMLVSNAHLGSALATQFSKAGSYAASIGAAGAALVSQFTKAEISDSQDLQPDYSVVLMRGHGFTTIGTNIPETVYRAVYAQQNANVQTTSLLIRNAHLNAQERGKKEEEKNATADKGLHVLSDQEAGACLAMNERSCERAWELWVREVEVSSMYQNRA